MTNKIRAWTASSEEERRAVIAARHGFFCRGKSGEVLEHCTAASPGDPHDEPDGIAAQLGASLGGSRRPEDIVAVTRLILSSDVTRLPTARSLARLERPSNLIRPDLSYAEASRLGLLLTYQGTPAGRHVLLRLIGLQCETAIQHGFDHYLVSLRDKLMISLRWFPWRLGDPFDYPASEGGTLLDEPMWPATLNLHELALVARHLRPPDVYPTMFPVEPSWVEEGCARPIKELEDAIEDNHRHMRAARSALSHHKLKLAKLRPRT